MGYFVESLGLQPKAFREEKGLTDQQIIGRRLRRFLEELGPTFIKVGQLLSVRPDLVPPDVLFELEKLQDKVEPFPFKEVERIFEEEFETSISQVFKKFEPNPIASASIGQVHVGYLKDGSKVAVKVQRPEAKEIIEADIDWLFFVADRLQKRVPHFDLRGLVSEFSDSFQRELDYRIEARHIDRFRHNFRGNSVLKIPVVYWRYTSRRVLTMEFIEGTKVDDLATPQKMGIDTYYLAIEGAKAFMKQVLEDGFFHGDLHPANVLITPEGKIAYLDFGIVGWLSDEEKEVIARLLLGIIKQDVEMIINEAKNLGVIIPTDNLSAMRRDLKEIVDAYYGRTLGEMSIDIIGKEFLNLIYRYKIQIPQQYALLAKALITVEGVAKKLYPQINIIEVAKPYVTELMRQKFGPEKMAERFLEESKGYFWQLLDFPRQLYLLISNLKRGDFQVRYRQDDLKELAHSIMLSFNRLIIALYLASFLLLFPIVAFLFPGRTIFLVFYTFLYFLFFLILLFFLRRE